LILSDLSIKRPVFATVLSLLLVVLGLIAYTRLTLRELPAIVPPGRAALPPLFSLNFRITTLKPTNRSATSCRLVGCR
jgi:hypothetical protein